MMETLAQMTFVPPELMETAADTPLVYVMIKTLVLLIHAILPQDASTTTSLAKIGMLALTTSAYHQLDVCSLTRIATMEVHALTTLANQETSQTVDVAMRLSPSVLKFVKIPRIQLTVTTSHV
jgi:hypothetical protein